MKRKAQYKAISWIYIALVLIIIYSIRLGWFYLTLSHRGMAYGIFESSQQLLIALILSLSPFILSATIILISFLRIRSYRIVFYQVIVLFLAMLIPLPQKSKQHPEINYFHTHRNDYEALVNLLIQNDYELDLQPCIAGYVLTAEYNHLTNECVLLLNEEIPIIEFAPVVIYFTIQYAGDSMPCVQPNRILVEKLDEKWFLCRRIDYLIVPKR